MSFKQLNILIGWLVFLIATATYVRTIESTTSFWDCGEFIATAYKLQVGHPPGAPLFMLLARLASAFVPVPQVSAAVNVLSSLCSSFTILFLFWSITHLAHKLAVRGGQTLTAASTLAVLGSGVVGALAYTWSDSFWFSAVEGEVYALSSLFTAAVFWAILKWESQADEPHDKRWLVLIAYLMGLSLGVHLLNLLCIPAIAFVYYFRKYTLSARGVALTFLVSCAILGFIQGIIIPGTASIAGKFELLLVNDLGAPFNTGNVVYGLLVIAGLAYGLYYSHTRGKVILNTVVLSTAVIILGYSTYSLIVVRSAANPPIDENNPENVFSLVSYLNREQYGDRPLISGQFWDSPMSAEREDGKPVYTACWLAQKNERTVRTFYTRWNAEQFISANPGHTVEHKYVITDARKGSEIVYDQRFTMLFPRMYSPQESHVEQYKQWSDFKGTPTRATDREGKPTIIYKPTFGENLRFFFDYQLNFMYWRYFMWNYAGRQNDVQTHGSLLNGNWLTGFDIIDEQRLGNREQLTSQMLANKGYNRLYLLPLLLGVLGVAFQLVRAPKDWSVVMLLFFFTGVAIVIYLNQTPLQPRERDYAYVGSFYAFAFWIGLGVFALFEAANRFTRKDLLYAVAAAAGLGAVKWLMEQIGGGDHSTSYTLLALATMGGAALALMHGLGLVLRNQMAHAGLASALGLCVPLHMLRVEWDDHYRGNRTPARDLASDYLNSCAPNAILFTNGDNDTFPLWYAQEVEGVRTDVRVVNLSLLNTDWYIDQMRRKAYNSEPVPFRMPYEKYRQGTRDVIALLASQNPKNVHVDLKDAMAFATDDRNMQPLFQRGVRDAYIPSDRFKLPVDKAKVLSNGTVAMADSASVLDEVLWRIGRQVLMKNHFMVLDLLANNEWDRPIYFAVTTGPDSYINLQEHFQLEGLAYRLVPMKNRSNIPGTYGRVAADTMYRNVTERFLWGNMDTEEEVYLDDNIQHMTTNLRLQLANLADALMNKGDTAKAIEVLDLSVAKMPERNVPYDRIMLPTIEAYYSLGQTAKADALAERLFTLAEEEMDYYTSLEARFGASVMEDMTMSHAVMQRLAMTAGMESTTLGPKLRERLAGYETLFNAKREELIGRSARAPHMNF
jgi:Protein of unknown function (DUF2723)